MAMNNIQILLKQVADKRDLLDYLQQYMTEERSTRFKKVLEFRTRHFTIAIEDVYQERNASAIVRTADCFGIQDVYIIENHNEYQISEGISKGADKWVNLHIYDSHANNSKKCKACLKDQGYQIIATTPHGQGTQLEDFDIKKKSAFFLGGEKEGLTNEVIENADGFIRIPMYGFTESYNISVAGALLLYNVTMRLHKSDIDWALSSAEKLELQLEWTIKTIASSENLIRKYLEIKE
jgi:tRNA (guanosine-2'-O-)-methyltransferase